MTTDPVDELFSGALADFIKRRDALVKELKQAGDKDTAAAVKALRKPSTAAWSVNQVARRRPDDVDALIASAREVHAAQARAVQGKDAGELRTTTERWRKQIHSLAADVANDAGEQYRDDAAATFEAASTSEEWSGVLRSGRLMTTLSPSGFGLADMPDPVLTRRPHERVAPNVARDVEPEAEPVADPQPEVDQRHEKAVADARANLENATHRLRRAEQRLAQAQHAVDDAGVARDEAAAALRELEG